MPVKDLCDFCGGELKPEIIDLDLKVKGELIICEKIPADVCQQCGEWYVDAKTSKKIDKFLKNQKKKKPERYLPVPVFSPLLVLEK